ncbi:adventurous gliding motility protein GltJ [Stigmatella aurantiaca]|uniref:Adventurous gliding motility protein AgmX n=4 Tax=Stigmatella aurantiaca TaxID=41 RepID=E3FU93_STIAD|nr:adventurous gliding motility protein GltJ [Stigmatella aurantiaca]ADO73412.1 Adventurous gliding motility protein AgmX [Stigmatella aurantiaca DW4/3-1]
MRFVCDSCRAQYMISDDKVGAKGVKVRCKKCGHVILVRPAGATASKDDEAQETPAASAASNGGMNSTAAGLPASLGTPPEGGLFTDVEEDEIGAVFDQVLNSGSNKIPAGDASGGEGKSSAAVRKLAEAESEPDEPQSSAPAHDWFVAIDEKQVGPLTVEKVKDYWDRGEVGPDSLCWRQGFSDWIPLSEATELAPALAPRPAKPVIVAPAAMSGQTAAVSAPVESAFSAGAAAKSARAEIPPAPALGAEPTSSGWKPSAASVLASLVKEENDALSKPPKPAPVAEKPAVGGLLDLPPPEASAPVARAAPMMAAASEHAPQPAAMPYAPPVAAPAYPQPAPAYPQPAYAPAGYPQPGYGGYQPPPPAAPQGGSKTGLIAGIAVAAIAVVGVGLFFALKPSSQPEASPPVAAAPPPAAAKPVEPPPAAPPAATPTPPVVAAVTPPPPAAPAPTPAAPAATPPAVAVATPPPPAAVEPAAAKPAETPRTEPAVARQDPPRTSKPRPSQSEPVASVTRSKPEPASDDDFDELFGSKKTETKKSQESTPSTYIPPAPGSGGNVREQLAQSDVMEVVLANRPAIVKCVSEQKKREPGSSGKLVMRWVIQTSGRTTGVAVRTEEFRKTYLATCISGLIKGWTFPKHRKQGDPIDFPFTF